MTRTAFPTEACARKPNLSFSATIGRPLDFRAAGADTISIYSPSDMPQGLWRGSAFAVVKVPDSEWEMSHAC